MVVTLYNFVKIINENNLYIGNCRESTLSAGSVESCPRTVGDWREAGNKKTVDKLQIVA